MTTNQIRQKFLEFFKSKNHTIVDSDSLVPKDDPTVLFTTAGMQQFKRQFLGHIDDYTRATTSQKCMRTDDLDDVGRTDFHHTFFEMLGNFSFGDYFKKEAIAWGWEFLTKELKIPEEKLWVSVYKDDQEAEEIWLNDIKIDKNKLVRLGDHSNFWPADAKEKGPNGPCGPCSEIFFDYGENPNCKSTTCDPDCDCGRFSEVWNLVFTQFNRKDGGQLEPLPSKNIDTGMGLERLCAVIQGKTNNYEIDAFAPILESIDKNISLDKPKDGERNSRFVIADHMRAIVFGISDGVLPSNEGRGYVIKKLIIDITDIVLQTGESTPTVYKLVDSVTQAMKEPYPELLEKANDISSIVKNIESSYIKVRKERLPIFEKEAKNALSADALGKVIFQYRDTYGLALSTLQNTLQSLNLDQALSTEGWNIFETLMQQQQQQSRERSKISSDVFADTGLDLDVPKTKFLGYDQIQSTANIVKLLAGNKNITEANEGDEIKVVLDQTPFYAESGGQVGDQGILENITGSVKITDTKKMDGIFIHSGHVTKGSLKANDSVDAKIDESRRLSIMRNHSATHILQAGLRTILGTHVQQQGSLVAEDRLRFDFSHHSKITDKELLALEQYVYDRVLQNNTITKEELSLEQAKQKGALAFFAEKYGKTVRVVSMGDYSIEFCGGTHLNATGEIGLFKIVSEGAVAQGVRRIEAKTGKSAFDLTHDLEKQALQLAVTLKAPKVEIVDRVVEQTKRIKSLEKNLEQVRFDAIKKDIDQILTDAEDLNDTKIINVSFNDLEMNVLRKISDLIRQKTTSFASVLGAKTKTSASIIVAISDDLVKKGIKANDVINDIAPLINGSGGGRPQMAQAGSKESARIGEAIKQANQILKEKVGA